MDNVVALRSHIGGSWIDGTAGNLVDNNPAHPDEVVAIGGLAGLAELDAAVEAARQAATSWAREPMHARAAILTRAAELVERSAEAWGRELTREEGKTLAEGVGEVRRAAQILRYCGGAADREAGVLYSSPRAGEQILVTRKPIGVVAAITPFNFPIAIPAWKIAPALVYGNTVVWKPASSVPLLAMRLAQALTEAGLPPGVLNLLLTDGGVGNALAEHAGIDAITFTGSTGVGRRIAASAAARGVPVQAEMGGKNAAIVLADADLSLAADQVMLGAFRSAGQKCTATSRLVLDEAIAEKFLTEAGDPGQGAGGWRSVATIGGGRPSHQRIGTELHPAECPASRCRRGPDRRGRRRWAVWLCRWALRGTDSARGTVPRRSAVVGGTVWSGA